MNKLNDRETCMTSLALLLASAAIPKAPVSVSGYLSQAANGCLKGSTMVEKLPSPARLPGVFISTEQKAPEDRFSSFSSSGENAI